MNQNPIIVIDDDDDDLLLMERAFKELKIENEIITFNNGLNFLEYMKSTDIKTFFILCDINMNLISGLELKRRIYEDEELRLKCVPFVFLSTGKASGAIMKAYSIGVQGYFIKPNSFFGIKEMLLAIINYWKHSEHPNS
jgi:CheY-like chemotaxis protein